MENNETPSGDETPDSKPLLPSDPARSRFSFESADDIELVYPEPTEEVDEHGLPVDGWEVDDGEEAAD